MKTFEGIKKFFINSMTDLGVYDLFMEYFDFHELHYPSKEEGFDALLQYGINCNSPMTIVLLVGISNKEKTKEGKIFWQNIRSAMVRRYKEEIMGVEEMNGYVG